VNATNAANADTLDGQDSSAFAAASHTHDGGEIVSGRVGEAFIDDAITRDTEVLSIVQNSGGSGSGINADFLDGFDATAFFKGGDGVQVNQTTPLAGGTQEYWFTFGYPASQLVVWRALPTTNGGKLRLEVETEYVSADNTVTYYLRVFNTGTVATTYQLIRTTFFQ
jgi:hypothetical protein